MFINCFASPWAEPCVTLEAPPDQDFLINALPALKAPALLALEWLLTQMDASHVENVRVGAARTIKTVRDATVTSARDALGAQGDGLQTLEALVVHLFSAHDNQ